MNSTSPTAESIDAELAGGFRGLSFRADLEDQYEVERTPRQKRHLFVASVLGVVSYDMFLINDWTMMSDVFWEAIVFRLGIFTPISMVGIAMLKGPWSLKTMEKIASFVAILAVALVMSLYSLSGSVYRNSYQYGPMMIVVFAVVVQRIRVRYGVSAVVAMLGVQLGATLQDPGLDVTTFQAIFTICSTISILVLFAAYGFESECRRSYLLSVRSHLMNEQLERYGKLDPLTGLWNRRHLNSMMTAAWMLAEAMPAPMAVILLDIDHFKLFNDTYGHLEGDSCLQRVSRCLRAALEQHGDVVVRFGGEEFLIFVPGLDARAARIAAHLLLDAVHGEAITHAALGAHATVTASIGVATGRAPYNSADALMAAADRALYEAKRAGRNRIHTLELDDPTWSESAGAGSSREVLKG